MYGYSTRLRQIIIVSGATVILIVFIIIGYLFFSSSTITITTSDPTNQIILVQSKPERRNVDVTQENGRVDARIAAGTYTVTISNGGKTAAQIVTLGMGEHKNIIANLGTDNSVPEPVSSLGAGDISASKDSLKFIDRNSADRPLYGVDSNNVTSKIDTENTYQRVWWANPAFGIGLVIDKNNQYSVVKIVNNATTKVTLPFKATAKTVAGVTADKEWYISDTQNVYRANQDGSFTQIYNAPSGYVVSLQSVSSQAVLLTQQRSGTTRGGASLIVINKKQEKYQIEGEAYEAAWSPSGEKLIVSGDTTEIFDKQLRIAGSLPAGNFNSPVWLDDNTLLYAVSGNVYRYDLQQGKSIILASITSTEGIISQIAPSSDGDYLYFAVQKGGNRPLITFGLNRIGLQGQPQVNELLQKLNLLVPNTVAGCSLNYMGFTKLTVLYQSPTRTSACEQPTRDYFTTYGIDSTPLNFQYFGSTK